MLAYLLYCLLGAGAFGVLWSAKDDVCERWRKDHKPDHGHCPYDH